LSGTLGRLPNLWKNPDEFMPERFLHSNDSENSGVEKEEPFAWLAFLAGKMLASLCSVGLC